MVDVTAAARKKVKDIDLKHQPGFSQIAWFCIAVLYAPIAVLVLFSFNENRSVTIWTQFSLDWYVKAWNNEGIQHAALVSLEVALVAMLLSTIMA
ncbi:MAG: spermidine/putrescine ABC transporter permease PotC, partial [Gammaproteobacteria bacterium]|nr:spermidine/putrescine ABC transporter permease PotC [Gammaproteobacteria bacterium]